MASTHDETDMLGSSPMKKRRGRPSMKKNLSGGVIGESTIPMALNSSHQQSAHELSEATVKQGFCSTPVMRLSPSKDNRLGPKSAAKTKAKAVLYEINNNGAGNGGSNGASGSSGTDTGGNGKSRSQSQKRTYNELFLVSSTASKAHASEPTPMASMTTTMATTPQKTSKTNGSHTAHTSTLSSSSPLSSNILTSDPIHQSSSPLQTSPLPSEYSFNNNSNSNSNHHIHTKNLASVNTNAGVSKKTLEEKPTFSVQSSPFYSTTSRNYDDQIFKYINSSPISTANTPKRRGFDNNMSLDSVMRMQRSTGRTAKTESTLTTPTCGSGLGLGSIYKPYRQQPYRYRLSYRYKLTLDIDDCGKAKIYARVIENNIYTPQGLRYYDPSPYEDTTTAGAVGAGLYSDNEVEERRERGPGRGGGPVREDSDSDSDMENYEPSRYEQYLSEQREYNEQRQQIIRNSMKSDPYMTEYYTPLEYMSAANSPTQRVRGSRPGTSHGGGPGSHHFGPSHHLNSNLGGVASLHGQVDFEDYINQEYEKVKTVNINYVVNNSHHPAAAKGLSAGIEVDPGMMVIGSSHGGAGVSGCYPQQTLHLEDQHALRDETGRVVYQVRKSRQQLQLQASLDKMRAGNDAMAALRNAVLN